MIAYLSIPIFVKLQAGKYGEKLLNNISVIFRILSNNKFTISKILVYLFQAIFAFYFITHLFPRTNICASMIRDYFDVEDYYKQNKTIPFTNQTGIFI